MGLYFRPRLKEPHCAVADAADGRTDGRADGRTEKDGVKFLCVWSGFREKSRPWFTRAMLINVDWM